MSAVEMDLKNHRRESYQKQATIERKVDDLAVKVDLILGIVDRAKGIKWLLWIMAGFAAWASGALDWLSRHLSLK